MSIHSDESRFVTNVNVLFNLIKDNIITLNKNGYETIKPSSIDLMTTFIQTLDHKFVIKKFITKSYPFWSQIKSHDQVFFLENITNIFDFASDSDVDTFTIMYFAKDKSGNFIIKDKVKDNIWYLLDCMVKQSIKFLHKQRLEEFNYIDIVSCANEWKIKL